MDAEQSAQDVIRCDLCETPLPSMHCDSCHISLCKACMVAHLSDESKDHKVVTFNKRGSTINYPKCQRHSSNICELDCKDCNIPICASCISSGDHDHHKKVEILKIVKNKKGLIEEDLRFIKSTIYPKYLEAASNITVQRADVRNHSQKLTTALDKQRKALHTEIDNIIQGMKSEIDNMDAQHIAAIDRQEDAINHTITEITQAMLDLQNLLDSNDVCLVSEYTSRDEEFRRLPARFKVTLPTFTPHEINREAIYQQIGYLSKLVITYQVRSLLDKPHVLAKIKTNIAGIRSVSCLSDSEFWTCGSHFHNGIVGLYNLQGELLRYVKTKSWQMPSDIAVTRGGDLMYTDYEDNSINTERDTQIKTPVTIWGLIRGTSGPHGMCSTSSGDLLVIMDSDELFWLQTKVVRYTGSTETQSIEWDDQGNQLYKAGCIKYLTENRNLDICVADFDARAVVVVSAAGRLRFRYTGPSPNPQRRPFSPRGITTDSYANILTSDCDSHLIHIINQDGHFLRYICNCGLQRPFGLCVDSRDDLFVAEESTCYVKKIQYYE